MIVVVGLKSYFALLLLLFIRCHQATKLDFHSFQSPFDDVDASGTYFDQRYL